MELTTEQKSIVSQWVRDRLSLSDIQKRLESELEIRMTYMDVRFLIDDLNLELAAPSPEFNDLRVDALEAAPEPGKVTVSIDKLKRPDVMLSGSVTFSDGQKAEWSVDQMGRLGLKAAQKGYQPSPEDVREFQAELQRLAEAQQGML